jgi:hypothetical protein
MDSFLLVFFHNYIDSINGSLGIKGIENGFDQKDISTTIKQTSSLFSIGFDKFVECDVTECWVLDGWRDRSSTVSGTQGTANETRDSSFPPDL